MCAPIHFVCAAAPLTWKSCNQPRVHTLQTYVQPPEDPEALNRLMLSLARWAACVPFLEDASFRRRRVDVWTSSTEALELGGGDHEEHAHLLAGLFLEIGQQVSGGGSLKVVRGAAGEGAVFVTSCSA